MLDAIAHHLRTTYGYNIKQPHETELLIEQEIEFKHRAAKINLYGNDLTLDLIITCHVSYQGSSAHYFFELSDPDCLKTIEHYLEQHFHD